MKDQAAGWMPAWSLDCNGYRLDLEVVIFFIDLKKESN
jgi:hypothetical protein